jgi:sugar phosphate isomerase/epimerase
MFGQAFPPGMHNGGMISRRGFLQAGGLAAAAASGGHAKQLKTVGVQLYTVRTVLPQKAAETLRAIEAIGYREVEATQASLEQIWPALQATKLKPVSVHIDSKVVTQGPEENLTRAVDDFQKRGFSYVVFPYLPPPERGGLDVIKKLADTLNRAAAKCRAAGMKFAYHNHAFEFEPMGGSTPFQTLLDNTDPKLVGLEMDVFWVSVGGHDPVELLGKLKGRVPLMHLKDKAAGTANQFNEGVPRTAFKEVGNGTLDWAKILKAADAAGVEHYFVEQDQTPGDPVESLRQSYAFISKLNY